MELSDRIGLAIATILSLASAGGVDARLSLRHADLRKAMGSPFNFGERPDSPMGSQPHWSSFVLYGHFTVGDRLLSLLCIFHVVVGALVFAVLLGLLSFQPIATLLLDFGT